MRFAVILRYQLNKGNATKLNRPLSQKNVVSFEQNLKTV